MEVFLFDLGFSRRKCELRIANSCFLLICSLKSSNVGSAVFSVQNGGLQMSLPHSNRHFASVWLADQCRCPQVKERKKKKKKKKTRKFSLVFAVFSPTNSAASSIGQCQCESQQCL